MANGELQVLLEAVGSKMKIIQEKSSSRVLVTKTEASDLETEITRVREVVSRLSLTHHSNLLTLFLDKTSLLVNGDPRKSFLAYLEKTDLPDFLTTTSSFAVRVRSIGLLSEEFRNVGTSEDWEKDIGKLIADQENMKVNLKSPEVQIDLILSEDGIWFGPRIATSTRREIMQRSASKRPFFHPSAMNPILVRAMVNLSKGRTSKGSRMSFLDPFCGTGGSLLEFLETEDSGWALGLDIDLRMIQGAKRNLDTAGYQEKYDLILADARFPPFRGKSIGAICTDPPYGRTVSTWGQNNEGLTKEAFQQLENCLKPEAKAVVSYPSSFNLALQTLWEKVHFDWYVHKSLTRKILVYEKL